MASEQDIFDDLIRQKFSEQEFAFNEQNWEKMEEQISASEQESFDDIIRQKFAEKQFVFNEENWEKMEEKIAGARKVSRNMLWAAIFSIGLISGLAIMYVLSDSYNANSENTIAENNTTNNEQVVSNSSDNNESDNNNNFSTETSVNTNSESTSTSNETESNTVFTKEENVSEKTNEIVVENNYNALSANKTSASASKNNTNKSLNNGSNPTVAKANDIAKPAYTKPNAVENKTATNQKNNPSISQNESAITTPSANIVAETKKSNEAETVAQNTSTVDSQNENISVAKNNASTENTTTQQPTIETTLNTSETNTEKITAANENTTEATPIASETTKEEKEIDLDSIVTAADLEKADPKNQPIDNSFRNNQASAPNAAAPSLAQNTMFTIDLGANYMLGWNNNGTTEARGFNPLIGIGIDHMFNKKWAVQTGVQYGNIGNLKATTKTFSNTQYGFGSVTSDTTINTQLLHYLVVPVIANYNIDSKNALIFGINGAYLLNAKSSMTISSSSVGPPPAGTDTSNVVTNNSITGYYDGAFNKFDATIGVGYRRRITHKLSVSALFSFGVTDIKKNDFFGVNTAERNTNAKVTLTYSLFGIK